jgi:hypothetical protein
MAYIGKSPDGTGVRSRFYYTQSSGGGTSVSGSSDDGTTLAFSDGAYVDVFLNGVLLVAGTDYNTSTANTIAGLAALANGDVVEVVVYDIFTVADTVSALNGGTFSNNVTINGDLTVDTNTLFVDASADAVGINTTSPDTALHVKSANDTVAVIESTDATSKLQLKDNSSTNGASLAVTNETFSIQVNGGTRATITSGGNIGINETNPTLMLSLQTGVTMGLGDLSDYSTKGILGNIHPSISSESLGSTSVDDARNLGFGSTYTTSAGGTKPTSYGTIRCFEHYNGNLNKGAKYLSQLAVGHANNPAWYARNSNTTDGTSYGTWYQLDMTSTSDERSKENVENAPDQLAVVKQFQVKEFDYIDNADEPRQLGMMAQHVDTFAPEYVTKDDEDPDIMWRIKYNKMVPMLIKALQEATARIETLETKVAALEAGS